MSYVALPIGNSEPDKCPGKFEVWAERDDGEGRFLWCAGSCPSPWKRDIWMNTGQETCTMPWSDYESIQQKEQADPAYKPSGVSKAGIESPLLAVVALAAVVGGIAYLTGRQS